MYKYKYIFERRKAWNGWLWKKTEMLGGGVDPSSPLAEAFAENASFFLRAPCFDVSYPVKNLVILYRTSIVLEQGTQ